jgi:hypothetical protein
MPADNPFRGNWYKKRDIVRAGRSLYEELHALVSGVWEPLFEQFDTAHIGQLKIIKDRISGLDLSDMELDWVSAHVSELPMYRSDMRKQDAEYAVRMSEDDVRTNIAALREQLNFAYKRVVDFERALDVARQHAGLGSSYEQQAWKYYVDMDAAYDDREAQLLLQKMMAQRDHLQELITYVSSQLTSYCAEALRLCDDHIRKGALIRDALIKAHVPLTQQEFRIQKDMVVAAKSTPVTLPRGIWYRAMYMILQPMYMVRDGLSSVVKHIASLFGYASVPSSDADISHLIRFDKLSKMW